MFIAIVSLFHFFNVVLRKISHVTCAPLADVAFERRFFPASASVVCAFHNTTRGCPISSISIYDYEIQILALIDLRRIDVKQKVYVYAKDEDMIGRGRVRFIYENVWATVDFLDGSVSKEIFSCEIVNCECKHFGCNGQHIPGSLVCVFIA